MVEDLAGRAVEAGAVPGEADRVRAAAEPAICRARGASWPVAASFASLAVSLARRSSADRPAAEAVTVRRAGRRRERRRRTRGGWNGRGVRELELCGHAGRGLSAGARKRYGAGWRGQAEVIGSQGNGGASKLGAGAGPGGLVGGARW